MNKTNKILPKTLFILILSGLAYNLIRINSEFFVMLFKAWDHLNYTLKETIFMSIPYSAATIFIMLFFRSRSKIWTYIIRIIFPLIDGFIVMALFNTSFGEINTPMSIVYGIFTTLTIFFVSETGKKFYRRRKSENQNNESLLLQIGTLRGENERLLKDLNSQRKDFDLIRKYLILGIEKQISKLRMKNEYKGLNADIIINSNPELKELSENINLSKNEII